MGLQFEGAIDNVTERQMNFVREILEKRGYKDTTVKIEVIGNDGDNYVASVKRVIVNNGNGEFRMVAKFAPQQEMLRASMKTDRLFRNEHIMYTQVLPKFQELEKLADVPTQDRFRFAECYGSLSEAPNEVILLEDLKEADFVMLDRFKPLSEECIKSVLKNFASLHSLSYALKHKEPDTFKEFTNGLFDLWGSIHGIPETATHFSKMENSISMIVEGDDRKRKLKGSLGQAMLLAAKMSKQNAGSKHSIIQQGDSWTNNILFKFDGGRLEESVMIDYQLSNEASPACDLLYMIFNCTDHKSRLQNYNDWIDYYHSELEKALSNHGLKANYVYSRDQLDTELKGYAKIMFGITVITGSVTLFSPESAMKMKDSLNKPVDQSFNQEFLPEDQDYTLIFKKRLEGLIDSYVKFGLL